MGQSDKVDHFSTVRFRCLLPMPFLPVRLPLSFVVFVVVPFYGSVSRRSTLLAHICVSDALPENPILPQAGTNKGVNAWIVQAQSRRQSVTRRSWYDFWEGWGVWFCRWCWPGVRLLRPRKR